ncbi:thiamine-phosphate kinase [Chitinimonas koreensis]|uniref:thiamine-phosphate kinase n=1 Tax=Chitinimonas koreensis TaxID=356302 RepID=UPI00041D43A3|nr:thiamine-phosphate kinase [Chitinimonas koreensis]QNM95255.1 thiamine-phosphate kinase [Chitinimonas koreensis]
MPLDEFDLIRRYFTRATPGAALGIGDDAALIAPAAGLQLAVAADTMVEGRHFFAGADPYSLGWKSLAVNLSDMAAMGAAPRWFTLCLTLPAADAGWLADYARGLFALADAHGAELIGGDTTSGLLAMSIQILGEVEPGQALRRDGARDGDDVWLSGPTGAAALAVRQRYGELALAAADLAHCAERLDRPVPRVALGRALRGLASAAIDVSDGLAADLGHIARASGLAAEIELALLPQLPLDPAVQAVPGYDLARLAGGDDYELCFTAAPAERARIAALGAELALPLARIGAMRAGRGVTVRDAAGQPLALPRAGFNHFD